MKILITGASGFVGRQAAIEALHQGHHVVTLGRSGISDDLLALGAETIFLENWSNRSIRNALKQLESGEERPDVIMHLAGDASYGRGSHYVTSNVEPTRCLIEWAQEFSPNCRFLLASSVGAQDFPRRHSRTLHDETTTPVPRSDYGKSKLAAEEVVRNSRLNWSIARLGMVIGDRMRKDSHVAELARLSHNRVAQSVLTHVNGVLPLIHVDDCARALMLLVTSSCTEETFLLVSENVPISNIVQQASGRSKHGFTLKFGPLAGLLPAKLATVFLPVMAFDNSKIRELGWRASVSTRDALQTVPGIYQDRRSEAAVVTGVASGLGKSFMLELIERGATVIGVDINQTALDDLRNAHPEHHFICADVAQEDAWQKIELALDHLPAKLYSLYLIAGIGRKGDFGDQPVTTVIAQFQVNVISRLVLASEYLRFLERMGATGRLAIVSSSTALQPMAGFSVYGATNSALYSFIRTIQQEIAAEHCQVIGIIPGGMDTGFQSAAGVRRFAGEKLLNPRNVARRVLDYEGQRHKNFVIGRNARLTFVLTKFLPVRVADFLWARASRLAR
jgi:nucleoside-diphosphate-sugar epimerase